MEIRKRIAVRDDLFYNCGIILVPVNDYFCLPGPEADGFCQIQETEEKLLRKRESGEQANQAALDIIPTTQHILDNYDALATEEKNHLWKLVLRKVTAYRTPDGKLSVHNYPKLPKAI